MGFREGDQDDKEVEKLEDPNDDESTKVRLDDAEDDSDDKDDDEPEPKAAKGDDQPRKRDGKWAEKKAERGKDRKAAKAWESEKADYDRRFQQMREDNERSVRQLREDMERSRQTSGQPADPVAAKLTELDRRLDQELKLIETDPNHGYGEYRKINDERNKLIAVQAYHEQAARAQQSQRPPSPYDARRPFIESEYPWTMDSQRYGDLARKAWDYRQYLISVEGRPDTIDTDREALSHIQAKFGADYGLRQPAQPSQRTRSLYAPPASRGTPDRRAPPREVDLGVLSNGHGLSPKRLAAAVSAALQEDE